MSWKENGAKDEGPDLDEILSKIKDKFSSLKSEHPDDNHDVEPDLLTASCSCENENKNKIVDVIVYCGACSNQLFKKTLTKPFKVAAILAILAYGTGQFIEYVITDNRYPMTVEYEIISACIDSYQQPVSYPVYGKKKDVCLCALEDTMNEVSYLRYQVDEDGFLNSFEGNAANCQI